MLGHLIDALHESGAELYVDDLLDMLWLATRRRQLSLDFAAPAGETRGLPVAPPRIEDSESDVRRSTQPGGAGVPGPGAASDDEAPVYASGDSDLPAGTIKASPVVVPAGQALLGRLNLARVLRPFRQRRPSPKEQELDELQTVETAAELGGDILPVFRPLQERWFDVDVVLEDDPAIALWRDTMHDFCQMLRDTGAFRDVRSWRLRMPEETAAHPTDGRPFPYLEAPGGGRVSGRVLVSPSGRRLIFFASHGASRRWLDGSYATLLSPWLHTCSVVLLHLRDRQHWKSCVLGEPQGLCRAREPGAAAVNLHVEKFWWTLNDDEAGASLPLPAVTVAPTEMGRWAQMQMGRGRDCPVFLLNPQPPPVAEGVLAAPPRDMERAIELLREASPSAFRLAVYLSTSTFTLAVARLVQEARFGADAIQSDLAEVLLSGLVSSRPARNADPNELYYEFHPAARRILLRSLREADAASLARELERRLSRYIERIRGRSVTFRGLVADENGQYDLPDWAQPFARLGLALLGEPLHGKTATQLLREFRDAQPAGLVLRAARLAAATPTGGALRPQSVDADLWDALLRGRLVRQDHAGRWTFLAGLEPSLARTATHSPLLGIKLLIYWEVGEDAFVQLGANVDRVYTKVDAVSALRRVYYDVIIISESRLNSEAPVNFGWLRQLPAEIDRNRVIIYTSEPADARALSPPPFAVTDNASELRDLVLDAAGRSARFLRLDACKLRVLDVLPSLGVGRAKAIRLLDDSPEKLGSALIGSDTQRAFKNHLEVIRAYAGSGVNQLFLIRDGRLRAAAAILAPETERSDYQVASWDGLIGRSARNGEVVWVPDVTRDPENIDSEPGTRSELALPLRAQPDSPVLGVINVELDRVDALTETHIEWLRAFCAPLARMISSSEVVSAARPYRKIFACYSQRDRAIVEQFEHFLTAYGDSFLHDTIDLRTGEIWGAQLMRMIREADIFQLFWSSNAAASRFVRREVEYAVSLDRPTPVNMRTGSVVTSLET
jgi:hypothetical protein